ncbi:MAG TPA: CrcB family protein [Ktedonobacteraceae bacterium]|nr:CrcB family protein [Ktedonobacteraceae bacterium]
MTRSLSARRRMFAVLCGGFCGTITRFALSSLIQGWFGKSWPYDILIINITGALLLAFVTALADATFLVGPTRRVFINVGLLGAYTTFSSLALGDVLLFGSSHWLPAMLYLLLSIVGGVFAVMLGDWLGQWCLRTLRRPAPSSKGTRRLTGILSGSLVQGTTSHHQLDIQDDLLLPELQDERESRQKHSGR